MTNIPKARLKGPIESAIFLIPYITSIPKETEIIYPLNISTNMTY